MKLSELDKKNIEAAIANLEKESSGEIVPYILKRSAIYREVNWMLSCLFVLFGLLTVALASYQWLIPDKLTIFEIAVGLIVLGGIGFGLPIVLPSLVRFLGEPSEMNKQVYNRACEMFLKEEVFSTRDRTGILIFVSSLEHKVLVLADKGINSKVLQSDWDGVVEKIVEGIKKKELGDGMVHAINQCKELLLKNGFIVRPDDIDEISNKVRTDF